MICIDTQQGKAAGPKAAGSKAAGPTKKKKPTIKSAAGLPLESIEIKSDDWDELFLSDGEWDRRTQRGRGAKGKSMPSRWLVGWLGGLEGGLFGWFGVLLWLFIVVC